MRAVAVLLSPAAGGGFTERDIEQTVALDFLLSADSRVHLLGCPAGRGRDVPTRIGSDVLAAPFGVDDLEGPLAALVLAEKCLKHSFLYNVYGDNKTSQLAWSGYDQIPRICDRAGVARFVRLEEVGECDTLKASGTGFVARLL